MAQLAARIAELTGSLGAWLGGVEVAGLVSLAFDVDRAGRVRAVRTLSDTTRSPDERGRRRLVSKIRTGIASWRFGAQRGISRVTLPLVFVAE